MNKLIISFVFFVCLSTYSQNFVSDKDLKHTAERVSITKKKISLKNADEENVMVTFSFDANNRQFGYTSIKAINLMIHIANMDVMRRMKNKYSYIPKRMSLNYDERYSHWVLSVDYLSDNEYGGTINGLASVKFAKSGEWYDTVLEK